MGTFNDGDSGSSIRTKINTAIQKTEGSSAISTIDVDGGAIDGVTLGTNSAVTEAQVDNININGNAITSTDSNGNIALTPNGSGEVDISKVDIDSGAIDGVTIGTNSAVTDLRVDNLKADGNTISTTNTNGNLEFDPNGSGKAVFKGNSTKGAGQFVLNCEQNSHGITVKGPPHSAAASYTLTLPNDDGASGQSLISDGSGVTSWSTITSNATHTGEVTGSTSLTIADNVVDEANLKVSNSPTNGYFLQAQSGNTGGLTWAAASGGGGSLSGNMAGDIASNGHDIIFADNDKAKFGAGDDLIIYHDSSTNKSHITESGSSHLVIQGQEIEFKNAAGTNLLAMNAAQVELMHSGNKKLETYSSGIETTGTINVNGAYTLPTSDGSANQVLQTDGSGALSFATAAAGGSWNLISTTTVSSAATNVDFTSISGYKTYALDIRLSFNYGSLNMRFGTNGTYDSGSNYEGATAVGINTSAYKYGVNGLVYIRDLERATTTNFRRGTVIADVLRFGSSSLVEATVYAGYYGAAGANCIRLYSETDKIVEGTVSLYGLSS